MNCAVEEHESVAAPLSRDCVSFVLWLLGNWEEKKHSLVPAVVVGPPGDTAINALFMEGSRVSTTTTIININNFF